MRQVGGKDGVVVGPIARVALEKPTQNASDGKENCKEPILYIQ